MKTIYLVRHGKSSWQNPGQKDHERPLLWEGIERTKKIVTFLTAKAVRPAVIFSSHAVRALETARVIAEGLGVPPEKIRQEREIYLGTEDNLLDIVASLPEDIDNVMLVGHNPVMTGFAQMLQARLAEDLPTSSVVSITFDTDDWTRILLSGKQVDFIVFPRML